MTYEDRFFPVFEKRPEGAFLERWRRHISETGYPETFERVSNTKPAQLGNIVLLSEDISVPTALRKGGEMIPCPFCSKSSPKFKHGRMAYFPDELAVRFIGPRCAQTHFGDNYKAAERLFARQEKAGLYIRHFETIGNHSSTIGALVDALLNVGADARFLKNQIEEHASGFCRFLHRELAQTKGDLIVREDLGTKDRNGNAVLQERVLGAAAGLLFLEESFSADKAAKRAQTALGDVNTPLPEWKPSTPEHPATDEILRRGRSAVKALRDLERARDALQDTQAFLQKRNLSQIQRWGKNPMSGFAQFEIKREKRQLLIRAKTFAGEFYANALIPEGVFAQLPGNDHPALRVIEGISN